MSVKNTYPVKLSGFPIDAKTSAIEDYINQFVAPKNLFKNRSHETKTFIGSVTFECETDDPFEALADAIKSVPFADKYAIYPELNIKRSKIEIKKAPMIFEYKEEPFIIHPSQIPKGNDSRNRDIDRERRKDREREERNGANPRDRRSGPDCRSGRRDSPEHRRRNEKVERRKDERDERRKDDRDRNQSRRTDIDRRRNEEDRSERRDDRDYNRRREN